MEVFVDNKNIIKKESELIGSLFSFHGARVIELGCGSGAIATEIQGNFKTNQYVGCEVDSIQHRKNVLASDRTGIEFVYAGAEKIPCPDSYFDYVLMFKSLHHVPVKSMPTALSEIGRVLKVGGVAWISEPVYKGDFNELVKIFNDEGFVRENAFKAVCDSVEDGIFKLREQIFFYLRREFSSFEDFESKVVKVTYSENSMSEDSYLNLRKMYGGFSDDSGRVEFLAPMRIDVLEKV
jgi:ubiquinone/menaquinone biosynthesis C-methylase UbiE